jgi:hypothetical protein
MLQNADKNGANPKCKNSRRFQTIGITTLQHELPKSLEANQQRGCSVAHGTGRETDTCLEITGPNRRI